VVGEGLAKARGGDWAESGKGCAGRVALVPVGVAELTDQSVENAGDVGVDVSSDDQGDAADMRGGRSDLEGKKVVQNGLVEAIHRSGLALVERVDFERGEDQIDVGGLELKRFEAARPVIGEEAGGVVAGRREFHRLRFGRQCGGNARPGGGDDRVGVSGGPLALRRRSVKDQVVQRLIAFVFDLELLEVVVDRGEHDREREGEFGVVKEEFFGSAGGGEEGSFGVSQGSEPLEGLPGEQALRG